MRFRKLRMFLHYITFGLFPRPNMIAEFFGATIGSENQKFMDAYEPPPMPPMHPSVRGVDWLDKHFGD